VCTGFGAPRQRARNAGETEAERGVRPRPDLSATVTPPLIGAGGGVLQEGMELSGPLDPAAWLDEVGVFVARDPDTAVRRLEARELLDAVGHDPTVAVAVLRALAALAWRSPAARAIYARVPAWPTHRQVVRWRERVEHDLIAGHEFRACHRPILPPYVLDLVADAGVAGPDERRATAAALLAELRADPMHYLESFDVLDTRCFPLAEALTPRLLDDVGLDRRELDVLPAPLAAELGQRLTRLGGRLATMLVALAGGASLVAGAGIAIFIEPALGIMAGGGGVAGSSGLRGQAYRRSVRRELAVVVCDLGITRAAVREAMRRRGGRLAGFAAPLGNDRPMRLLAMLAAAAHTALDDGDGPA
jgi:hypothetical protein